MITEQFINLCCAVLLDDNPKFTKQVISDISSILNAHSETDIPIQFKKKYVLTQTIIKLKIDGCSSDQILDNLITANHFSELESYIKGISKRKIEDEKINAAINQICQKKQLLTVHKSIGHVEEFISNYNNNSFSDSVDILRNWGTLITSFHSNILEEKRKESRNNIKELDLYSDDYESAINQIEVSYSGKNCVSTGYRDFDSALNGGFEPGRLYVFGGCSGDGKSVLLNNLIKNAVDSNIDNESTNKHLYIYFTMENLIDESLLRLWCLQQDRDVAQVIKNFDYEKTQIQKELKTWQQDHNSIICMSYFAPTMTSVSELMSYCDIIKNKYEHDTNGQVKLRGVYVDYLDLLKSGQTFDLHRLEMGQVTIDMKVAAVMQNIPWITVTQLNRSIFLKSRINIKGVGNTTLDQVKVGDYVRRGNKWVKVLKVFPKEKKKCYKIKTKSGKEIICGPKHEFPTSDGLKNIQYTNLKVGDKLYTKNDHE